MALSPSCAYHASIGVYNPNGGVAGFGGHGDFAAGERITVSAGPPEDGPANRVTLYIDPGVAPPEEVPLRDTTVDCVAYPGTVGYTFLADGHYRWFCETNGYNVTWTVNCGVAPPFDPVQEITDLKTKVAGLTIASSVKGPLIYVLDEALDALAGQAVIGWGRQLRNRGLATFRRSSTAARFLEWAGPDPCSSLQTFLDRVTAAFLVKQLTGTQACQLEYVAKNIRRMLNC